MRAVRGFAWYLQRLKVMEPREILHRLAEQSHLVGLRVEHCFQLHARRLFDFPAAQFSFCRTESCSLPELPWEFDADSEAALDLLSGRLRVLGRDWAFTTDDDLWQRAPDTGRLWPRIFFGDISHRAENPYGDPRIVWEAARLQQLVGLALLARHSHGDKRNRAIQLLEDQFFSWVAENPPYAGIHYVSAMECGLRIISVCHALDMARAWLTRRDEIWPALISLISSHARLIEKRLSLYSSAGNHTISECAGLIYAGALFPELPGSERWKRIGIDILAREARVQILSDGSSVEQAFRYLLLVADLLGLVTILLQKKQENCPIEIYSAWEQARSFLQSFSSSPGDLPAIGDSDDGYALSPFLRLAWGQVRTQPPRLGFEESGYTLIKDSALRMRIIMDHGPLGKPPNYAHGHADALSLMLWIGNEEVLVDPGTYTYTGDVRWRNYFRDTRAHNTVMVDGVGQARQETPFSWSSPYTSRLVRRELDNGCTWLVARHDGYLESRGVVHWRAVAYLAPGRVIVWDRLAGEGRHRLELNWHCGLPVTGQGELYALQGLTVPVSMRISGADSISLRQGELDPICGWRSKRYGEKSPVHTLQARTHGKLPHEFVTQILIGDQKLDMVNVKDEVARFRRWLE